MDYGVACRRTSPSKVGPAVARVSTEIEGAERDCQVVQRHEGLRFIAPDRGGKDVFVHIKAVQTAGSNGLVEGGKVAFDVVDNRGKQAEENLRVKRGLSANADRDHDGGADNELVGLRTQGIASSFKTHSGS
jgi:CspA family cold shock protein